MSEAAGAKGPDNSMKGLRAMRSRKTVPGQLGYSIVRHDGVVVLPIRIQNFVIGQRVYFDVHEGRVLITPRPQRAVCGRFLSGRVRLAVRSLATYGPRVAHPLKGKKARSPRLLASQWTLT